MRCLVVAGVIPRRNAVRKFDKNGSSYRRPIFPIAESAL